MTRASPGRAGRRSLAAAPALALAASMALAALMASPAAAKGRTLAGRTAKGATSAAFFRAPSTDGLLSSPRQVRARFTGRPFASRDLDLDDPFGDDASGDGTSARLTLAPGWTATAAVSTTGRSEELRPPLDRDAGGFSSRLIRSLGHGASVSGSIEADPSVIATTLEAKREIRRALGRGRSVSSALEVGYAHEEAVGHGLYAAFAPSGALPVRPDASPVRHAVWVNGKATVEVAPGLALSAEFEAETSSAGPMALCYFGVKRSW